MLIKAQSPSAADALELVSMLQARFVRGLEQLSSACGHDVSFENAEWLRDGGEHGGGNRYSAPESGMFNRASVNVSQVHYDDLPEKKLGSATAISTIIHPQHPHAPSVHIHISWTEMKAENEAPASGYWRIMADLNPSVVHGEYRDQFEQCMREVAPEQYEEAAEQGDRYFYIPALKRHRGVTHFYLESYATEDAAADRDFAELFGKRVIDAYLTTLQSAISAYPDVDQKAQAEQLAYHTLYLFQVLTLDRGTTSGLLVHDQNDLGIMGSLPARVDRDLLASWQGRVAAPQDELVQGLVQCLPDESPSPVSDEVKRALAQTVRSHYQKNPEALALQASGNVIAPTVDNHR
ncbi:MAG: coproporphyrinogen III oxidase [Akkermansiaceae bacterium]